MRPRGLGRRRRLRLNCGRPAVHQSRDPLVGPAAARSRTAHLVGRDIRSLATGSSALSTRAPDSPLTMATMADGRRSPGQTAAIVDIDLVSLNQALVVVAEQRLSRSQGSVRRRRARRARARSWVLAVQLREAARTASLSSSRLVGARRVTAPAPAPRCAGFDIEAHGRRLRSAAPSIPDTTRKQRIVAGCQACDSTPLHSAPRFAIAASRVWMSQLAHISTQTPQIANSCRLPSCPD